MECGRDAGVGVVRATDREQIIGGAVCQRFCGPLRSLEPPACVGRSYLRHGVHRCLTPHGGPAWAVGLVVAIGLFGPGPGPRPRRGPLASSPSSRTNPTPASRSSISFTIAAPRPPLRLGSPLVRATATGVLKPARGPAMRLAPSRTPPSLHSSASDSTPRPRGARFERRWASGRRADLSHAGTARARLSPGGGHDPRQGLPADQTAAEQLRVRPKHGSGHHAVSRSRRSPAPSSRTRWHTSFITSAMPRLAPARKDTMRSAAVVTCRTWLGAFRRRGSRCLRPRAAPNVHPHAVSSPEERGARWDRDMANYPDRLSPRSVLLRGNPGRPPRGPRTRSAPRPWNSSASRDRGTRSDTRWPVVIENTEGRAALDRVHLRSRRVGCGEYNRAAVRSGSPSAPALPLWPDFVPGTASARSNASGRTGSPP